MKLHKGMYLAAFGQEWWLTVPMGKGGKLIVYCVGGGKGFIAQCKLVIRFKKSDTNEQITNEHNSQMNNVSFKKWFTEDLYPSLVEPTFIIVDIVPHHILYTIWHQFAKLLQ